MEKTTTWYVLYFIFRVLPNKLTDRSIILLRYRWYISKDLFFLSNKDKNWFY